MTLTRKPPADNDAITELREFSKGLLPQSYYDFLVESNGGEGEIPFDPYYVGLFAAEEVIDYNRKCEFVPAGLIVIGTNGGGELIVFDTRKPGPYVSSVPAIGCEYAMLMLITPTFEELLRLFDQPVGPPSEWDIAVEQQAPCLNVASALDGEFWPADQLEDRRKYYETQKYLPEYGAIGHTSSGIIAVLKSDRSVWLVPALGTKYLTATRLADSVEQLHDYIEEYKRIWSPQESRYYEK